MKSVVVLLVSPWALAAPLVAGSAGARHAALASPLLQVIGILDKLRDHVAADDIAAQKVHNGFVRTCSLSSGRRTQEVKEAEADEKALEAAVMKAKTDATEFKTQIDELSQTVSTDQMELDAATKARQKEADDFKAVNRELLETLETLDRAMNVLEKETQKAGEAGASAFLQRPSAGLRLFTAAIQEVVDSASIVASDEELQRLSDIVQGSPQEGPASAPEQIDSGTTTPAMKALQTLKEKVSKTQTELRDKEAEAQHQFELLKASLTARGDTHESVMEDAKVSMYQAHEAGAAAQKRLNLKTQDLANLKQSLSEIQHECMFHAAAFKHESEERKVELEALAQAKKQILSGISAASQATSFLQLRARSRHASRRGSKGSQAPMWAISGGDDAPTPTPAPAPRKMPRGVARPRRVVLPRSSVVLAQDSESQQVQAAQKALSGLQRLVSRSNSTALEQLASRLKATIRYAQGMSGGLRGEGGREDPFSKVKEIMEEMIARLERDSATDTDRKKFCESELKKTEIAKEERERFLATVATKIEKDSAELAARQERFDELSQQVRKLVTTMGTFDMLRKEERDTHENAMAFLQQALQNVQQALQVLRDYYGTTASDEPLPAADLRSSMTENWATGSSAAGAQAGPGSAIIGILEVVNGDFASNLASLREEEVEEAKRYVSFQKQQLILKSTKEVALKQCEEDQHALKRSLTEMKSDQSAAQEELDAAVEYMSRLQTQCVTTLAPENKTLEEHQAQLEKAYQDRKMRRAFEEAGIREALQILSAMDQKADAKGDEWKTAVRLSSDGAKVDENVGQDKFNLLFAKCPVVRYLRNGAVHSIYVRTTPVGVVNAYELFTFDWTSTGNVLHTDFDIYDTLENARFGENRWQFCSYGSAGVGYPCNCGRSKEVPDEWFSVPGSAHAIKGITSGASLEIYSGGNCPSEQWRQTR